MSSSLPLVWVVAPANASERSLLVDNLLPRLFERWPDI